MGTDVTAIYTAFHPKLLVLRRRQLVCASEASHIVRLISQELRYQVVDLVAEQQAV